MSASDWVLIIGAVFGGAVLVINAFGTFWGRHEAKVVAADAKADRAVAQGKLDVIHDLTNSNLSALKGQLTTATARIEKLEALLVAQYDQQRQQGRDGDQEAPS